MNTLQALQRALGAHVLHGDAGITPEVCTSVGIDAPVRLEVYSRAYRLRLLEVLADHYPGLRRHLGEDAFETLGRSFIDAHPSSVYNIRWYGAALPAFVARSAVAKDDAAVAEMAQFEWAMTLAFDATDDVAVGVDFFASVAVEDWPGLRFAFVQALQRVSLTTNVAARRAALDRDEALPGPESLDTAATWAIWRDGGSVLHRRLEADEAPALAVVSTGGAFADLCDALASALPEEEIPMRAASLLKRWVEAGWIRAVSGAGEEG